MLKKKVKKFVNKIKWNVRLFKLFKLFTSFECNPD